MTDTFCILPWIHLSVTPKSHIRLCCMANGLISKNNLPMSLFEYSIDQIWNSEHMRSIRKDMIENRNRPECQACYSMENSGLGSYRMYMNNEWQKIIGPYDPLLSSSRNNAFRVSSPPNNYHFITGNLCNLKCRMCNSWFSSQVEQDPVHSQWSEMLNLNEPDPMMWKEGVNVIAPKNILGVEKKGFYAPEYFQNKSIAFTTGKASLHFNVPGDLKPDKLSLKLSAFHPSDHHLKIILNKKCLFKSRLSKGPFLRDFDISDKMASSHASLHFISDTFRLTTDIGKKFKAAGIQFINKFLSKSGRIFANKILKIEVSSNSTDIDSHKLDMAVQLINERTNGILRIKLFKKLFITCIKLYGGKIVKISSLSREMDTDLRKVGIAVEQISLSCKRSTLKMEQLNERNPSAFSTENPWYAQKSAIVKEMLKHPRDLRELHFSGGEPFMHKTVEEMIDYLIDKEATKDILLKFNTNCTVVPDRMVEKLKRFEQIFLALSIDAYGKYWEYIRYPGKWKSMVHNIEKLKTLRNAHIITVPVLQVYNALNIVELLEYTDSIGLECQISVLTAPWFLNISVLPKKIRRLALKRLNDYIEKCGNTYRKNHLLDIANSLDYLHDDYTEKNLKTLMVFTNDLDVTRNQHFRETHKELLDLLEEEGFLWTDERKYA